MAQRENSFRRKCTGELHAARTPGVHRPDRYITYIHTGGALTFTEIAVASLHRAPIEAVHPPQIADAPRVCGQLGKHRRTAAPERSHPRLGINRNPQCPLPLLNRIDNLGHL